MGVESQDRQVVSGEAICCQALSGRQEVELILNDHGYIPEVRDDMERMNLRMTFEGSA